MDQPARWEAQKYKVRPQPLTSPYMPPVISRMELLSRVRDLQSTGRTRLVAIDGWGGAGKTTLARRLADELAATVVRSDDFSRPGAPQWDWPRFASQVLVPLSEGRKARYQRYDWDEDRLAEWHEIDPGGLVIAEGVSISRRELGDPWGLKIWVDCPFQVRLARIAHRDGVPADAGWVKEWVAEEEAYVRDQLPHERADYVVLGWEEQSADA